MQNNKELFLKTPPKKLFWRVALPGSIAMLVSSLYGVLDSIFVGKILGVTALAALNLAIPIVVINFAFAELVGVGSSVPISILLGKKRDEEANAFFTGAILLISLLGLISGAIIFFSAPYIMLLMGADGVLADLATRYVRIYALFSPLINLMFALDNYLRISGKIKTSMFLNIFFSLLTIALELVFLLVCKMGAEGTALGAVLAMSATVIIGLTLFARGKLQLKFVKFKFEIANVIVIFKNGISAFLANVSGRVFSVIMNVLLLAMGGKNAVATYGVIMTVYSCIEMLLYGLLDSVQPAIGYNYGAKQFDRVKKFQKLCFTASAIISVGFAIIILLLPSPISQLFLKDASILEQTAFAMRLTGIAFLLRWIALSAQCFFSAIEKPLYSLTISSSQAFIFPMISVAILIATGLLGLWLNLALTAVFSAILSIILLLLTKKKIYLLKEEG